MGATGHWFGGFGWIVPALFVAGFVALAPVLVRETEKDQKESSTPEPQIRRNWLRYVVRLPFRATMITLVVDGVHMLSQDKPLPFLPSVLFLIPFVVVLDGAEYLIKMTWRKLFPKRLAPQ